MDNVTMLQRGKPQTFALRLPERVKDIARAIAANERRSLSGQLEILIMEAIQFRNEEEKHQARLLMEAPAQPVARRDPRAEFGLRRMPSIAAE